MNISVELTEYEVKRLRELAARELRDVENLVHYLIRRYVEVEDANEEV